MLNIIAQSLVAIYLAWQESVDTLAQRGRSFLIGTFIVIIMFERIV